MPTSISHLGGRARVNEPGRYRKKNNKNLTAQGLPTYIGMPQPLRNLIAKRVKSSQAVTKKKKESTIQCANCKGAAAGATVTLKAGSSISGTVKTTCATALGDTRTFFAINNNSSYFTATKAALAGLYPNLSDATICCIIQAGEDIDGCPPSGMYFSVSALASQEISVDLHGVAQNHYEAGETPATYKIEVKRDGVDLGSGVGVYRQITLDFLNLVAADCDGCTAGDVTNDTLVADVTGATPGTTAGGDDTWSFMSGVANTILDGDTIRVTFNN